MKLVFASNNSHKLEEVRQIMPEGVEVLSLSEIGFCAEIEETGTTLAENSRIKAETVWEWICHQPSADSYPIDGVFADDTGLEINALGGKPGVYTARWWTLADSSEEECRKKALNSSDQTALPKKLKCSETPKSEQEVFGANCAKALRELAGKSDRSAQFKTVITLIRGSEELQVEGVVRGQIAREKYGNGGFGYDPVFIPEGYDKTFAELPAEVKNQISHRARALAELKRILKTEN